MLKRNKALLLAGIIFSVALLVHPVASQTPPMASFTYSPAAPILGQTVIFDASASTPDGGEIVSYTWDFDDGTTQSIDYPVTYHDYETFGTYNVTLTVTDDEALTDTAWSLVTVREYPVASFTYSPANPLVDETVTFNASDSTPEGGEIVSYYWDFGDETANVTTPIIYHSYAAVGTYNVTLTVTDDEALADTTWSLVTVRDYPVALFTHSPERPIVNETATFNASPSTPDGGSIISYAWNFGDQTTGTGKIVTHAYATIGTYNVTLTVTDNEGLTDTAWKLITVRAYPVAFFTYSPANPLVGETVTFDASLSAPDGGSIVSYSWSFGDGKTGTGMIVTHAYTTFGSHTVTLTVRDNEDLTDTYSAIVRILIAPVAGFTYSPTKPIINQTVTFDASASYDPDRSIISYAWNFGDQTTGTGKIVTHAYATFGTYNVTLTITDDDGLTDTTWKLITVYTSVPLHDVAIINVAISRTEVYIGQIVNITVVVKNEGTSVETFDVTVYYGSTSIGVGTVTNLLPNLEATLKFSWNTAGVAKGNYVISANAVLRLVNDDYPADNTLADGTVKVKLVGDLDGDGMVYISDLRIVSRAYDSKAVDDPETPWDEDRYWDPRADISPEGGDGHIYIGDLRVVSRHYEEGMD